MRGWNRVKRIANNLEKVLEGLFAGLMTVVVLLVLIFTEEKYFGRKGCLLPNWALMGAAMVLSLLLVAIIHKLGRKRWLGSAIDWLDRRIRWICLGLFLAEGYISFCIFFKTGWDVGGIWEMSWQRINGCIQWNYFSRYPNNLLLFLFETFLLRCNNVAGVFPGAYAYMCCIVVDCAAITLSCYLTYQQMKLLTGKGWALVCFLLCVMLAGLSPWMCIFYSDSLGILFPILTLYLYTKPRKTGKGGFWSRIAAIITGCVGYFLKPQCMIIVIAILLLEVVYAMKEKNKIRIIRAVGLAALTVAAVLVISNVLVWRYESTGAKLEKDKSFGIAHFLMMGLNEEKIGAYSGEDVDFSASFETSAERNRADLMRAADRLKQMGAGGYLRHLSKKLLVTFNSGIFGWWGEGTFYTPVVDAPNSRIAPLLRSLYYRDGERFEIFKLAEQACWMTVLLLCMVYGIASLKMEGRFETSVLKLAVLGTALFQLLFETRARYLFIHIPLFCCLAGLGLWKMAQCISQGREKE